MPSLNHGRLARILRKSAAAAGSVCLTVAIFLVLPLMETIRSPLRDDLSLRDMAAAQLPPPPPPPLEPEPEEEEPEEQPPELVEQAPPLDLSELELALDPSGLDDALFGEFSINLAAQLEQGGGAAGLDEILTSGQLDQRPRALFRQAPSYPTEMLKTRREATVYVLFVVDMSGRVADAKVQKSTDPGFNEAALAAVRQWRFEPGKRNGENVRFKMRQQFTFRPPS